MRSSGVHKAPPQFKNSELNSMSTGQSLILGILTERAQYFFSAQLKRLLIAYWVCL